MSDYYDGRHFLYALPFGEKGELFYNKFYEATRRLLAQPIADWDGQISSVNKLFSVPYSEFENQSDPHLNLGLEGSLRAYGDAPTHKTRAFLLLTEILQRSLTQEANLSLRTRGKRIRPKHLLPSPLYFLRGYLTDPNYPASEAYAHAIVRSIIFASAVKYFKLLISKGRRSILERTTGLPTSERQVDIVRHFCSFELIVDSIRKIQLHKSIRDISYPSNPSDLIVMHMLASRGYMLLSFPLSKGDAPKRRPELQETRDEFLNRASLLGEEDALYEFRLSDDVRSIPSATEIVNELDGLPIAIPNADIIFARGLRFTGSEGTVLRLTGPSGGGKTSVALGLATALAPLGIDCIYLSCEENADDLERRIQTMMPDFIRRTESYRRHASLKSWFQARHLSEGPDTDLREINRLVDDLVKAHGEERKVTVTRRPLGLTPLMIVLDGIHELLWSDRREASRSGESRRLRQLVENMRRTGALIVVMSADFNDPAVADLDYVADIVADISFEKVDDDVSQPLVRKFVLRKTRRQYARMGAHLLTLSPTVGVSLTPQISAQRDVRQDFAWVDRNLNAWFDAFHDQRAERYSLKVHEYSQVLVTGRGSSGKAAFALRLISGSIVRSDIKDLRAADGDLFADKSALQEATPARKMLLDLWRPKQQRRVLVVSFLYQQSHYAGIKFRLEKARGYLRPPPELEIEVLPFYPGYLRPEDFLRKLTRELEVAELQGSPFSAVVIDGLHNVFMQFPRLQESKILWPVLFEILRKYHVTVVTTHTHMDVPGSEASSHMAIDLDVARERAAPILQALINAADFFFDISSQGANRNEFVVHTVNASDQPLPPDCIWDSTTLTVRHIVKSVSPSRRGAKQ